jgi:phosphonate transport system substrate-binding protein
MKKIIASLLAFVTILSSVGSHAAACDTPEQLRFSFIPEGDVRSDIEKFKPLLERIEKLTGKTVEMIIPTSYATVIEGLVSKSIDFALLGPASYAAAKKADPDVTIFATYSMKSGKYDIEGSLYYSLLVVKRSGSFADIGSLRGATLALTDPGSTSGFVVPRHFFPKETGQLLDTYFSKIVYTGDHNHAAMAVLNGQVDAAFVSSYHLSSWIREGKIPDDFKVLWHSEPIPFSGFAYRGNLCAPIKKNIIDGFLKASPEQSKLLLDGFNATKLVPASDADYRMIHELY